MKCPKCYKEVPSGEFCVFCGEKLGEAPQKVSGGAANTESDEFSEIDAEQLASGSLLAGTPVSQELPVGAMDNCEAAVALKGERSPLYKKWQFWVGLGGAAIAIVAVVLFAYGMMPKVPSLIGMTPYEAQEELLRIDSSIEIELQTHDGAYAAVEAEDDYKDWTVSSQSVSSGSDINVTKREGVVLTIEPSEELMQEHERIVNEYIDTQIEMFEWNEGDIKYRDYGDVIVVRFKSLEEVEDDSFAPTLSADGSKLASGQVEVDQLASATKADVVVAVYKGDWLSHIYAGLYSESPSSARSKAGAIVANYSKGGDDYARENAALFLVRFERFMNASDDPYTYSYRLNDDGSVSAVLEMTDGSTWRDDEQNNDYAKNVAFSIAHFSGHPAQFEMLDRRGVRYSSSAFPSIYLYNREEGQLVSSQ